LDETFVDGAEDTLCLPPPLKVDKNRAPPPPKLQIDHVEATGDYAIEEYDD
jgi:hypothetical protein